MFPLKHILSFFFILISFLSFAQIENEEEAPFINPGDTLNSVLVKRHSPKKAALLSFALPGAGQAYNKKYWKIPIVYAGLGGLGTWIGLNSNNLKGYTKAYKTVIDDDPNNDISFKGASTSNELGIKRDDTKRSLDLSIILFTVFYGLNIIDATVDAHLFDYSITESLSVSLEPEFNLNQGQAIVQSKVGLNFSMYFDSKD